MGWSGIEVVRGLSDVGVRRGDLVGLAVAPEVGLGLATSGGAMAAALGPQERGAVVAAVEAELRPRWVMWSNQPAAVLLGNGVRLATCWDVSAVHRLLFGGWPADPARVWAQLHRLALEDIPTTRPADLFHQAAYTDELPEEPVGPDGYLRPEWASGGWSITPDRLGRWAGLAVAVARLQQTMLRQLHDHPKAMAIAHSESAAELLCSELSQAGLPMDRAVADDILSGFIGRRPRRESEAAEVRAQRDAEVLRHIPSGIEVDLRSPGQVKTLLGRLGVDVPDTRAWRLRAQQDGHPVLAALLAWRKAERMATTYGYPWLDEHLGPDGRLRGLWTGCDGGAGRMTASAGLHNMPADLRAAVVAETGQVFVRADLGQIEPRVLAAVSGDRALAEATGANDMYAPVAEALGVDRPTAKVAVLGAMYGQTTGHGARALHRLRAAYPVAMAYLDAADRSGQVGRSLRTYGGRLIPRGPAPADGASPQALEARAAARGRYGRNALVQGAAAELFKMWAVLVRAEAGRLGAQIVLCLHDELLVQAPADQGPAVTRLLDDALGEAVRRWAPDDSVRFVAELSVIRCWAHAKVGGESAKVEA